LGPTCLPPLSSLPFSLLCKKYCAVFRRPSLGFSRYATFRVRANSSAVYLFFSRFLFASQPTHFLAPPTFCSEPFSSLDCCGQSFSPPDQDTFPGRISPLSPLIVGIKRRSFYRATTDPSPPLSLGALSWFRRFPVLAPLFFISAAPALPLFLVFLLQAPLAPASSFLHPCNTPIKSMSFLLLFQFMEFDRLIPLSHPFFYGTCNLPPCCSAGRQ